MLLPSRGCQTCRDRRVKCDEASPICLRCVKSNRICNGMDDSLVIHIENSYASGRQKRPKGPRRRSMASSRSSRDTSLQCSLLDLRSQALFYYLHYYLHVLDDTTGFSRGIFNNIVSLWGAKRELEIVNLGVSTIALTVFSRTQHKPGIALEATQIYHRLLQISRKALLSLDSENIDSCLMAIFLMGRYEDSVHTRTSNVDSPFIATVRSSFHHDGALAVLKAWKYRMSHIQVATDIIKHARRGIIKSALMRNLELPFWLLEGSCFGESGLELEYDRILVRILELRRRIFAFADMNLSAIYIKQDAIHEAEELINESNDVYQALHNWKTHFPSIWYYHRHDVQSTPLFNGLQGHSQLVFTYSDPTYATVWNQYFAMKILVKSTCVRILTIIPDSICSSYSEKRQDCLRSIRAIANDLVSSISFGLQEFQLNGSGSMCTIHSSNNMAAENVRPCLADLVIWPLTVVSSIKDVDDDTRSWFRARLARAGRITGTGLLECAETDQWLEL